MSSASTPSAAQPAPQANTGATGGPRIRGAALATVLAALMLTLLLEALDQTVVGTALPKIIGQLNGFDRYTWVVTAYLLASTTVIPIVSKLSDQFGRKWFFLVGVAIFLLGSALSGASQTINQLIAFRALQGLGAGIGISLVFTVVGDIFPPAERARWQGIFASVYGFSSVVGPTVGGWLTDHGPLLGSLVTNVTRWRWVFYVNLPLGALALIALAIYLPGNLSVRTNQFTGWAAIRRIDFAGALVASAATICLLLGLTWGGNATYAWVSPQVIGALIGAGVLYALFLVVERFVVEPVLPLWLFKNQIFAASALLSLAMGAVLLSLVIELPLFLQGALGQSATNSGEVITPLTVSLVIGAGVSGFVIAKLGRYQAITIIGALVMTVGVFLLSRMTISTVIWEAAIFMVITGVGLGMFFPVQTLAVQNALPRRMLGVGTGAVRYMQQVGQTLGVAIVGAVVNNTIASDIVKRIPASTAQRLTPQGVKFATDPQVLVSPTYHDTVVKTAQGYAAHAAAAQAAAHTPPGPGQAAAIAAAKAQAIHETTTLLNQVFAALKQSLVVAIQHGLMTMLIFCALVIVAALLLKDVKLATTFRDEPATTTAQAAEVGAGDTSEPAASARA
ncbi:MAG TPA: MDR family MFS transporter [Ktedonobacterales bacterium]|nr:MDR family MFS transporter [Ktedonobacterales bacterium]